VHVLVITENMDNMHGEKLKKEDILSHKSRHNNINIIQVAFKNLSTLSTTLNRNTNLTLTHAHYVLNSKVVLRGSSDQDLSIRGYSRTEGRGVICWEQR